MRLSDLLSCIFCHLLLQMWSTKSLILNNCTSSVPKFLKSKIYYWLSSQGQNFFKENLLLIKVCLPFFLAVNNKQHNWIKSSLVSLLVCVITKVKLLSWYYFCIVVDVAREVFCHVVLFGLHFLIFYLTKMRMDCSFKREHWPV